MTRKIILPAVAAITGLLAGTGNAFADTGYGGYGNHPMMWGNWFMGPVMMLLMVAVVVVAVVVVLRIFGHGGQTAGSATHDRALAILNERFAKGELDKAEYEDRKKTLGG